MNTASVPRGVVPLPSDSDITKIVQIVQPSQSKSESMNVDSEANVVDSRKKHEDVDDATGIVAVTDLKSARTTKSYPSSKRGW